jgi:uncharacterized protein YndB with AHSA1/START domain
MSHAAAKATRMTSGGVGPGVEAQHVGLCDGASRQVRENAVHRRLRREHVDGRRGRLPKGPARKSASGEGPPDVERMGPSSSPSTLEEVFDAFTDSEVLAEVYGREDPGWIVEWEGDLRAGGTWSVTYEPSRDKLYRQTHVFWVIDRPRRITSTTTETAPDGSSFDSDVEITFQEQEDGKTRMTIVQRGFPSAEIRDLHEVGLPDAFDRINRVLRARAQSSPEPERGHC